MTVLKAISKDAFINTLKREDLLDTTKVLEYFEDSIQQAKLFSIAPNFWFIPDTKTMTILSASANIAQLTPYGTDDWVGKDAFFWMSNVHEEDREFVMAAIAMSSQIHEKPPIEHSNMMLTNIYCRMINRNLSYRWVLIQFPKRLYNEEGKVISLLALTTDLSDIASNFKKMMTVIDSNNDKYQYYTTIVAENKMVPLDMPAITPREIQIIRLMAKGLNTPDIVNELKLAYNTVENHKRNLRLKTKTKTSAELVNFMWENNLMTL